MIANKPIDSDRRTPLLTFPGTSSSLHHSIRVPRSFNSSMETKGSGIFFVTVRSEDLLGPSVRGSVYLSLVVFITLAQDSYANKRIRIQ